MNFNFLKKKDTSLYAVQTGKYVGEFLIFINKDIKNYNFLSTPSMQNRSIAIETFESGKKSGIIEFVEKLPTKIHKVCIAQYNKNNK